MNHITLGALSVSRLILGGNPFSGFSHQSPERDGEMRRYYTAARIKQTLREAEEVGIDTFIGRTDNHIIRLLDEYWNEGGRIKWVAQTASELRTDVAGVERAIAFGAKACYIHGGRVDYAVANGCDEEIKTAVTRIREAGLPAGVAGHNPRVFAWAEQELNCDFYMCCYYNPSDRARRAAHEPGCAERFDDEDRELMMQTIGGLSRPVIHYKVFAAGRKSPEEAWAYVAENLRPQDAVCVGVYTADNANMIAENARHFSRALQRMGTGA